ncbi:uncharacterized protein LOC141632881 [Silene latifolia]|uniref:uncharacterized protein LOC141632881 n=1 Tax=Silene latifolia TaxID=37657 RepID=UPI003D789DD7
MRYFPLIPRLERIYASSKTAEDMRWHHKERVKDGKLRHPVDALAWEQFDSRYPLFASDPRSVRLALASDGFNPYRLMNTTYSTWPVILIPYNLPPWLCMKPSSFILSCIIPGKFSPGIDIDVSLQPLISELNTAGYDACSRCTHSTNSGRFGGKICYVGHRNWLDPDHPYRSEANLFDGTIASGCAPKSISGSDVLRQQEKIEYTYRKTTKRLKRPNRAREVGVSTNMVNDSNCEDTNHNLWNKKSIFFELPYWEHNPLRHNLDVMHIEKNVCDNILGTLLDMDKSRDDVNARKGLQELGIKEHLWLQYRPNREPYMPRASYTMSNEEKERFLKVLQNIRAPDGYLEGVETIFNRTKRNDDGSQDMSDYLYRSGGRFIGMIQKVRLDDRSLKQAHRYILLHSDDMKEVLIAFLNHKRREMHLSVTQSNKNEWIIKEFVEWLQAQVQNLDTSTPEGQLRKALAGGLNNHAKRMTGFMINGYKFQTVDREQKRRTQNSGVVVEADGETYYGKLKDIYELDYFGQCEIVMFNCAWVDIHRGVKMFEDGSVCVNFSMLMHTGRNLADDPFVFSCQAKQVFYVEDEMQKGWSYVISTKPRDLIETGEIL